MVWLVPSPIISLPTDSTPSSAALAIEETPWATSEAALAIGPDATEDVVSLLGVQPEHSIKSNRVADNNAIYRFNVVPPKEILVHVAVCVP